MQCSGLCSWCVRSSLRVWEKVYCGRFPHIIHWCSGSLCLFLGLIVTLCPMICFASLLLARLYNHSYPCLILWACDANIYMSCFAPTYLCLFPASSVLVSDIPPHRLESRHTFRHCTTWQLTTYARSNASHRPCYMFLMLTHASTHRICNSWGGPPHVPQ